MSGGGKKWNLGKEYARPEPKPKPERQGSAKPENLRKAAHASRRDSAPPPPPDFEDLPPEEQNRAEPQINEWKPGESSVSSLGKISKPTNFREFLNHPYTLIGVAFLCILSVVIYFVLATRPRTAAGRYVPSETEMVSGTIDYFENRESVRVGGETIALPELEPQSVRHGRLLLATGQMIEAVAAFARLREAGQNVAAENYDFVPPVAYDAPMPPPEDESYRYYMSAREQMAHFFEEMGEEAVQRAFDSEMEAREFQDLARRIQAEGLALLDTVLNGSARNAFPDLDGAAERLSSVRGQMSADRVETLLELLFDEDFANHIQKLRRDYLSGAS